MEIYSIDSQVLVKIKEEILDVEDTGLDKNYKVKIKVENEFGERDWCIGKKFAPVYGKEEEPKAVSYHELVLYVDSKCQYCGVSFYNCYDLYKHQLDHLLLRLEVSCFQCNDCDACYATKFQLIQHISKNHKLNRAKTENSNKKIVQVLDKNGQLIKTKSQHQCEICRKVYNYKRYHDHMKTAHKNNNETYECKECKITFKCKRYLTRHFLYNKQHSAKSPSWRSHKTEDADINCESCDKRFYNSNSYKVHMKNVHCDTRYECRICKSKIKCKSYLETHIRRVHFNDGRKHKCDLCPKSFKSPRYVRIHKKNSHGVKRRIRFESSD